MLGAIIGDVVGSVYEGRPVKTTEFPLFSKDSRFTDDTVLTVATAAAILEKRSYKEVYCTFARRFPNAGYGLSFMKWLSEENGIPYNSWGNGSAMRVSPVGFAFDSFQEVLAEAFRSAEVTHNHPEGIKGAQATALAVYLARIGKPKEDIRGKLTERFGYNLERSLDEIRPAYRFDVSCQGSVPEAMIAFFEARDFESAIRNAVSLGGDSDTQAAVAGAIAQAYYRNIPEHVRTEVCRRLPAEFTTIVERFERQFPVLA